MIKFHQIQVQDPDVIIKHHKDALNTMLGHEISCNIVLVMLVESYKNVWKAMRGTKTSFEDILRKKQNLVIQ